MSQYNRIVYYDKESGFWTEVYRNENNKLVIAQEYMSRNNLIADLKYRGFYSSRDALVNQGEKQNLYKCVSKKNSIVYSDAHDIVKNQRYIDKKLKKWSTLNRIQKKELGRFIDEYTYGYKKREYNKKIKQKPEKGIESIPDIYDEFPLIPIQNIMINTLKKGDYKPKVYLSNEDHNTIVDAYESIKSPARTEVEIIMPQARLKTIIGKRTLIDKKKFVKHLTKKFEQWRDDEKIPELEYIRFQNGVISIKLRGKIK